MSLGAALRRFNTDQDLAVYDEVRSAAETAVGREAIGGPEQTADRLTGLGYTALTVLRTGLRRTIPPHFSDEQRTAFDRATGLYMGTVAELSTGTRDRNSVLASELLYLSQTSSLDAAVTAAVKSTVRGQLEEDIAGQSIIEAITRFPVLGTISSEIDLHHLTSGDASPDARDGFQRALFNSATALDALAVQQETL